MEKGYIMCKGRHPAPPPKICERYHIDVKDSLFPKWLDPFDYSQMDGFLENKLTGVDKLNLVVTGLSTALLEVASFCDAHNIKVTYLHYDHHANKYKVQRGGWR